MNHSTGKPSKIEQDRFDKMVKLGCVVCAYLGIPNGQSIEVHHLLDGNRRLGHWFSIPCCAGHHRACWSPEQLQILTPEQRVAISDGRKAFTRIYPTEWQLWDRVQFVMRLDDTRPVSKLVPRGGTLHVDAVRGSGQPAHPTAVLAGAERGPLLPGDAGLDPAQPGVVGSLEDPLAVHVGVPAARVGEGT